MMNLFNNLVQQVCNTDVGEYVCYNDTFYEYITQEYPLDNVTFIHEFYEQCISNAIHDVQIFLLEQEVEQYNNEDVNLIYKLIYAFSGNDINEDIISNSFSNRMILFRSSFTPTLYKHVILDQTICLYKGLKSNYIHEFQHILFNDHHQQQDENRFQFHGYCSTTFSLQTAINFAHKVFCPKFPYVVLRLNINLADCCHPWVHIGVRSESEIVFLPGIQMQILNKHLKDDNTLFVDVELCS